MGAERCEWCRGPESRLVAARLVRGGDVVVDGVHLCDLCARMVQLGDGVHLAEAGVSLAVTFLDEVAKRRRHVPVTVVERRVGERRVGDRRAARVPAPH